MYWIKSNINCIRYANTIAGFGIIGFRYKDLKENAKKDAWYQTIHVNNDNLWYGVKVGDNIHLLQIGNID